MWLKICVLVLCIIFTEATVQLSPSQSVFTVSEGSDLQVNCSSPNAVKWSAEPARALPQGGVEGSVAGNDNISTLTFTGIQKNHQAKFVCTDTTSRETATFHLKVFTVLREDVTYQYKEDALLNCHVDANHSFTYTWRKGGVPVSDLRVDTKQEFVQHPNGSLEIKNPQDKDIASRKFAGLYTCVAQYEDQGQTHTIETDVNYFAYPKVIPFDKSKNLVQDERLVVECKVLGYPKPSLTWYRQGVQITGEDKASQFKLSPADSYDGEEIVNGMLEIESVDFDDAGEFTCMAVSSKWPEINSTQVILVRVKDKLAALWPFLGIVAEVVVLCTIIFICEKRRNKEAACQEDANHDGACAEKKAEGVRHRGSPNNPRA